MLSNIDIDAYVAEVMSTITEPENQLLYGRLLFNNPAGSGAYNCARCHTSGFSYGATSDLATDQLHTLWPNLLNESGEVTGVRLGGFLGGNMVQRFRTVGWALVGLDVEGNKPAVDALVYQGRRRHVGHVTSAGWSPSAKRNVALATLRRRHARAGNRGLRVDVYARKELEWERTLARARVVARPFFAPARRHAVPAPA